MKKLIPLLLLISIILSFSACAPKEYKEIACEEIIKAYEDAGYFVDYH